MATSVINDPASLDRLRKLIVALDLYAEQHESSARCHLEAGNIDDANEEQRRAINLRVSLAAIRSQIVEASEFTLTDIEQEEPPSTLVGLVDWLRARLGRFFPLLPAEAWQTVGAIMMWGRAS